jgi:hypothetical protein
LQDSIQKPTKPHQTQKECCVFSTAKDKLIKYFFSLHVEVNFFPIKRCGSNAFRSRVICVNSFFHLFQWRWRKCR